ncbi:MAG: low temperature requirement protein A [Propionibacteriaceae bacterium]|jgi:low temperature requirement protein LtrA|nr:low temperature requirement protein A [Propionibacteriaceae bacterium]
MKIQRHPLRPMTGRNPDQVGRAATPLELLYDLTLVVAFGVAADQLAEALAEGHVLSGVVGFALAMYAVVWCWINFTWFSSAYDTDDVFMRLAVTVQMVGVVILTLGLPAMFGGLHDGWRLEEDLVLLGYVVMRLALLALWGRAWKHDVKRRRTIMTYIIGVGVAQLMWGAIILIELPIHVWLTAVVFVYVFEMLVPYVAETKAGRTPWHPHHIAERYGLLALIALGEGVVGTVAALQALIERSGFGFEAWLVAFCGIAITVGLWWLYFSMPSAQLVAHHTERVFIWAYGHVPVYAAIAATGAGLHLVALGIDGESVLGPGQTVSVIATAVGVYIVCAFALFHYIEGQIPTPTVIAVAAAIAVLAGTVAATFFGLPRWVALILVTATTWIPVWRWEFGWWVRKHLPLS